MKTLTIAYQIIVCFKMRCKGVSRRKRKKRKKKVLGAALVDTSGKRERKNIRRGECLS
jgi:hypothetical protein